MTEDLKIVLIQYGLPVIFILVGIIALFIGLRGRHKYKIAWLLGFALTGAGVIVIFVQSEEARSILVAFASIFAVLISGISMNQNAQIRRDTFEKEDRDHNDRLLNEILDWTKRVGCCLFDLKNDKKILEYSKNETLNAAIALDFLQVHIAKWTEGYKDISWQNAYILNISTRFGQALFQRVNELTNLLKHHNDLVAGITFGNVSKEAEEVARENLLFTAIIEDLMLELSGARIKNRPRNK